MAPNLKGPSAACFKSDRAPSPTQFITYSFFSNLNLILIQEKTVQIDRKSHFLSHAPPIYAFSPPVFLFVLFLFIFCLLFLYGLKSDRGVSPTNRDVGRRP